MAERKRDRKKKKQNLLQGKRKALDSGRPSHGRTLGQDLILWLPLELAGQSMKQTKSVFARIVATILICGFIPVVADLVHLLFLFVRGLRAGGFGIAFGPVHWHMPTLSEWLFLFSAFGLGYFWELRRLESRGLPRPGHSSNQPTS